MILDRIASPADVHSLDNAQLVELCSQLRESILAYCSREGGHVAPNLATIELTVALHHVFNAPVDKIIFDVSHQTYAHKMLTGRAAAFTDPARASEVSGFSNPRESAFDLFSMGHTSTSVSLACGLAMARDLADQDFRVVAVIGDGALSGGLAFEGLDAAGELNTGLIIIINDNDQSIAENHGGLYQCMAQLRATGGTSPNNPFRALGLDYRYLEQGNDVIELVRTLQEIRDTPRPVVLHVHTKKGAGFAPAETNPEAWHHVGPFPLDANAPASAHGSGATYAQITGTYLMDAIQRDPRVVAMSAGTPYIMGFDPQRRAQAGRQFIDVGIAEEHAVTCSAALALAGASPVFGVYGVFLQRAYDQLWHDVCLNSAPVTILDFGASVFGTTAETHLSFFDLSMVSNLPNLVVLAPCCQEEYLSMLNWALGQRALPVLIRVPGAGVISRPDLAPAAPVDPSAAAADHATTEPATIDWSRPAYQTVRRGERLAILGLGDFLPFAEQIADAVLDELGFSPTVINPRIASTIDMQELDRIAADHAALITLEDGIVEGGWGQQVVAAMAASGMRMKCYGISKAPGFPDRYQPQELLAKHGMSTAGILADVRTMLGL